MNKYFTTIHKNWKFFKTFNHNFNHFSFPAPNSIKFIFFGEPILSQKPIVQIAIISENRREIFGAVVKSPLIPNGF